MIALAAIVIGDAAILAAFAADVFLSRRALKDTLAAERERVDLRQRETLAGLDDIRQAIEAIDARLAALEAKRNGADPLSSLVVASGRGLTGR